VALRQADRVAAYDNLIGEIEDSDVALLRSGRGIVEHRERRIRTAAAARNLIRWRVARTQDYLNTAAIAVKLDRRSPEKAVDVERELHISIRTAESHHILEAGNRHVLAERLRVGLTLDDALRDAGMRRRVGTPLNG